MRFVRWYRKELALVFIRKATARKMRAEQVLRLYGQDTGSLHYAAAQVTLATADLYKSIAEVLLPSS